MYLHSLVAANTQMVPARVPYAIHHGTLTGILSGCLSVFFPRDADGSQMGYPIRSAHGAHIGPV